MNKRKRHHLHRATKKHEINALKWKNRTNDMRARRLQMGCSIAERDLEACQVRNLGDTSQTRIHGSRKIRQQTRSWNYAEQEVATKKSILSTSANGTSQQRFWSTINASSWWANTLPTPGMPTVTSKNVQNNGEVHEFQQKSVFRLLEETSTLNWDQEILTKEESTKYLGQTTTFQQQETTEIKNRLRAAWETFYIYKQELTSNPYPLRNRLRLFDTVVTTTITAPQEHGPSPHLTIEKKRQKKNQSIDENKVIEEVGRMENEKDGKEDKKNLGSSEDETEDWHSSNTNCDQDNDFSFMNDTDEEMDTAVVEEEDWIEHMKRSTDDAIEKTQNSKIQCWIKTHRRMKWRLAMRIASLPVERWSLKAAEWNPELSTKYQTYRAIGRPKEDGKMRSTNSSSLKNWNDNRKWHEVLQRMDQSGKKPRMTVNVGKRICKDSRRKICGQWATQRKPTTRSNPTNTILERGFSGRRRIGQHHIDQIINELPQTKWTDTIMIESRTQRPTSENEKKIAYAAAASPSSGHKWRNQTELDDGLKIPSSVMNCQRRAMVIVMPTLFLPSDQGFNAGVLYRFRGIPMTSEFRIQTNLLQQ